MNTAIGRGVGVREKTLARETRPYGEGPRAEFCLTVGRETGLSRFLVIDYLGIWVFCSICLFMQWWIESSATEPWIAFYSFFFLFLHLKRDSRHGFQSSIFSLFFYLLFLFLLMLLLY